MKAAWDRGEDYYDPARKEDNLVRTRTRLDFWEEHLKDPIVALVKAMMLGESLLGLTFGSQIVVASFCRRNGLQHRWCKDVAKYVGRALLGRRLALPCGCVHQSSYWNDSGKCGPHALIGLHFLAADGEAVSINLLI